MGEILKIREWKQTVIDNYRDEFLKILEQLQDPVIKLNQYRYQHLYDRGKYLAERIDVLTEGLAFRVTRAITKK